MGYGKDERMRTYKGFRRGSWKKVGVFAVIATVSFGMPAEGFLGMQMPGEVVQVYAAEDMLGYQNPKKIVISAPNTNNYSTTASKISILGACEGELELLALAVARDEGAEQTRYLGCEED